MFALPWKDPEKRRLYMRHRRATRPDVRAKDAAIARDYGQRNRDKRREYQRAHRAKNLDRLREYNARWHRENRANNPLRVRATHLKSLYGITLDTYAQLLAAQGGTCAACDRHPDGERHKVLHVDHDHKTGAIRGLLCSRCNTALGLVEDDPVRLHRYLMSRTLSNR